LSKSWRSWPTGSRCHEVSSPRSEVSTLTRRCVRCCAWGSSRKPDVSLCRAIRPCIGRLRCSWRSWASPLSMNCRRSPIMSLLPTSSERWKRRSVPRWPTRSDRPVPEDAQQPKLQKAIAHSGLMSRRAAEELIVQGRVTVDGRRARIGERVDPRRQKVAVDGKLIPVRPDLVTYLLYKPVGVISTAEDPQGRRTVVDLVPAEPRVYPVGRLDADSEGLILLTNDGTLADYVMHPRYGITKTYVVLVAESPGDWVDRLVEGVDLDDGRASALSARVLDSSGGKTMVELVMGEGRN